jgi:hypothetical protein
MGSSPMCEHSMPSFPAVVYLRRLLSGLLVCSAGEEVFSIIGIDHG